jgi:hypothetical protein
LSRFAGFRWLALTAISAVFLSVTGLAAAEKTTATTRTIEGRVLSIGGTAVPGAVVLLKDGKSLQVRSYIVQADGQYHFFGLSRDVNYTLRAENQGMTSKSKTVSVFDGHPRVKLDLKLSRKIQPAKK